VLSSLLIFNAHATEPAFDFYSGFTTGVWLAIGENPQGLTEGTSLTTFGGTVARIGGGIRFNEDSKSEEEEEASFLFGFRYSILSPRATVSESFASTYGGYLFIDTCSDDNPDALCSASEISVSAMVPYDNDWTIVRHSDDKATQIVLNSTASIRLIGEIYLGYGGGIAFRNQRYPWTFSSSISIGTGL